MSPARARTLPVRTALSGPAAGVVGAIDAGDRSGPRDLITLDMGGTSADVSLVRDLKADVALERAVAGLPIRLPSIDVQTVGAGGGSIAWFDRDGLLKVGPQSAGAEPGPACYGRGGTAPTVTDANLLLGRLSARGLLGGRMSLDRDRAAEAFAGVAGELGYGRSGPRTGSSGSSSPTWCARSAPSRWSAATTPATSPSSPSEGRGRSTPATWPPRSGSGPSSCRRCPASSAPRASSSPISRRTSCSAGASGSRRKRPGSSPGRWRSSPGGPRTGSSRKRSPMRTGRWSSSSTPATSARTSSSGCRWPPVRPGSSTAARRPTRSLVSRPVSSRCTRWPTGITTPTTRWRW